MLTINQPFWGLLLLIGVAFGCSQTGSLQTAELSSPAGLTTVRLHLEKGTPLFSVEYKGKTIVQPSVLGFQFQNAPALKENMTLEKVDTLTFHETWEQVWGEQRLIRNHYRQLTATLREKGDNGRVMQVIFRVFDNGIGFRYLLPAQAGMTDLEIMDEFTEFRLTADHQAWYLPCVPHRDYGRYYDQYEDPHKTGKISDMDTVYTPVTFKTADGLYLSLHEANLTNYSEMNFIEQKGNTLVSHLVPGAGGVRVRANTPLETPWRTLMIGEKAGDLIENYLILNLNEPNKLTDVSWIKPMKYVGVWWEMHLNKATWDYASGKHGATTANTKKHIDFAAKHGIGGVLVEGWNTGWEVWLTNPDFDFVTPYPDYDLAYLVKYAQEKGVYLISHHETSADPDAYDRQLDTAYRQLEKLGIHAVKTGYVGPIRRPEEHHHGQFMVNHYQRVVEKAAQHKVMVDAHEPIKDTGIRRTWPNFMTREGVRGQEYNAWSEGNAPDHVTILPFTSMLAGPIDYTPGIFDTKFDEYNKDCDVHNTLANQLALFVVLYSPMQMAADLLENYEARMDAFQFIKDVAVDWETTKVLNGEPGDFVTIARKERGGDRWFIGSVADENGKTLTVSLDFLDAGKTYMADIYADAPDAHYANNPMAYTVTHQEVNSGSTLTLQLAPGGGQAITLKPIN